MTKKEIAPTNEKIAFTVKDMTVARKIRTNRRKMTAEIIIIFT